MEDKPHRPNRRWRRFGSFVLLTVLFVFWLNGPGLRWLAPRVAGHFAAKAGIEVEFELRGTLLGGVSLHDVKVLIPGSGLQKITITEIVPDYQLSRLFRGEVRGVKGSGLHLDIVMKQGGDEPSEPLDFAVLNETLRNTQAAVAQYNIDVRDFTAMIEMEGMPVMIIDSTAIKQEAGSGEILVELGDIMRGGELIMEAQRIEIEWTPDRLGVDRVTFGSLFSVEGLAVLYPEEGALFAEGVVNFADAVFVITSTPGQGTLGLHLREGALDSARVGELLDMDMPVAGTVTSLVLNAENLSPDPMAANATLSLLVENLSREEMVVDELNLDVILNEDAMQLVARAVSGAAEVRVDATTKLDRAAMKLVETRGVLVVPSLVAVTEHFALLPEDSPPLPMASVNADFTVAWSESFAPASAKAEVELVPEDLEIAPGLELSAKWEDGGQVEAVVLTDGLNVNARIDLDAQRYSGEVVFAGAETARFKPWLAAAGIVLPGDAKIDATWSGSGPFTAEGHEGELMVASAVWSQRDQPNVSLNANVFYSLPDRISISDMKVVRDGQMIDAHMVLADGLLEIHQLRWTDADATEMADATGKLPMPQDFGAWREFLIEDTRPLDLQIRTRKLGFDKLATWMPALAAVDARTTGELEVSLAGNFAAPVLDVSLEILGLRSVDRPALPPADIIIKARGIEGDLTVEGSITTPDYAPVVLAAKLPFAPTAWAEDIETLKGADFEASANLPRLDLSRFAALVPAARSISGIMTGNVRASGVLGKPELTGRLELAGGSIHLVNDSLPQITGITALAEFGLDRAMLRSLRGTIAGGTFDATGAFVIESRELDFRIRGNSLPLVRNESLIVRANADLRVAGPIDQATLSGSISLVDSLLFRDIEILPIGTPFTVPGAAALPKIDTPSPTEALPEPFASWPLDVRLSTAEPFLIRGNLATGRIVGDLRVGGTLGDSRPNGTVRLLRGRAVLPFSTLAIPEATLTFTPANGLDPVIEARGSAEPRPYTVNLFAYGRLSDPQIVLSSNPPLPQNEIMTLLATGTTTRGLENPQMASARAIQLFAEEIRRGRVPMGNQLRPLLGLLDQVDFTLAETDPYSSDTYSTATLKLHDRWYLSAGMGSEGNTRMFAIWRLRFR